MTYNQDEYAGYFQNISSFGFRNINKENPSSLTLYNFFFFFF